VIEPPAELTTGSHDLVVVAPYGHEAHLVDAVRIFNAIDLPRLTVNTTADESDIQGTPLPGTEGQFLSLREALLIANFLAAETYAIDFDPAVFPPDAPAVISVTTGPQPLPPITHAGVVIDGFGAGVEISGANGTQGHGLTIRADDVWVRGVVIRDFTDDQCINVAQAARTRLSDNHFLRCDNYTNNRGAQVVFDGGDGHQLIDNQILDGGRDGIILSDLAPTNVLIEGNTFSGNGDDAITLAGHDHIVRNNDILANGGNGIEANLCENIAVLNNRFSDNGDGLHGVGKNGGEYGIAILGVNRGWQIADNDITRSHGAGIYIGTIVSEVIISRCDFRENGGPPIAGGASPPAIDSFDGTTLTGTSSEPGTIEVYQVDEASETYLFVATASSSGTWSVTLNPPVDAVAATHTTDNGTSEISAIHTP